MKTQDSDSEVGGNTNPDPSPYFKARIKFYVTRVKITIFFYLLPCATALWEANFIGASRPRPQFIEEINSPPPYSFTRSNIMRTKRKADWTSESEAAKRRRASEEQRIAMYKSLPRRSYAGSMVPLRSGGYTPNTVERKVSDIDTGTVQVNTTGSISLLCCPTLGSDMTNRIGRKILMKSVYVRGFVRIDTINVPGTILQQLCRMVLLVDMQPNGALPAVTDILKEASPVSQLNLNNRDRFKILCDKEWIFDHQNLVNTAGASYATAGRSVGIVKKYKKLNIETIFNGVNGGTIADITSGALLMLWIGSNVAGTTDSNAVLSTRVRYNDA